ncbi:MAG: TIGR04255 family protein [Verrucomicrobiales bacterium]
MKWDSWFLEELVAFSSRKALELKQIPRSLDRMAEELKSNETPSFNAPPVIETVLGLSFETLEGFSNANLGAYWSALPDDWSEVEDSRPVERQIERFDKSWGFRRDLKLTKDPSSRLTIFKKDQSRAIQLQKNGFDFSWIKTDGAEYPRYEPVRAEFEAEWEFFVEYLKSRSLGAPVLLQWEITYVNEIRQGTLWETPDDWAQIFSSSFGIPWRSTLADLESFSTNWHFQLPGEQGRLHVHVAHADRDSSTALMLVLTARGPIRKGDPLTKGLDLGREAIVKYFKEITSEVAHKTWGLEE